jgi:hypothetical protein
MLKTEKELSTALIYITNKFKNVLTLQNNGFIYNKLEVILFIANEFCL